MNTGGVDVLASQFLTSALRKTSGQLYSPAALPPAPIVYEAGYCGEKSVGPAKNRIPAVQPVAHRYTSS
jgi:hypothetical protein